MSSPTAFAQRQSSWCLTLRAMSLRLYCTNFTAIHGNHLPTFCTTTEPLVPALRAMSFRLYGSARRTISAPTRCSSLSRPAWLATKQTGVRSALLWCAPHYEQPRCLLLVVSDSLVSTQAHKVQNCCAVVCSTVQEQPCCLTLLLPLQTIGGMGHMA